MMPAVEEPNFGPLVTVESLGLKRAKAIAQHLGLGHAQYAHLAAVHKTSGGIETLVVDLQIEVPQAPVHDVREVERVAIRFNADDLRVPEVLVLRTDFPQVPHLNLQAVEYPKSLCLFDQPWTELKLRWTATSFIERIRSWFAQTARGELHAADQPLEPLLVDWEHQIVLPANLFEILATGAPARLYVQLIDGKPEPAMLVARNVNDARASIADAKFVVTAVKCEPQEHGVIRKTPTTLHELQQLMGRASVDLLKELRHTLVAWREWSDIHSAKLIVVVWFPKVRAKGGEPEAGDLWAFAVDRSVRQLAPLLQAWDIKGGREPGVIIGAKFADDFGKDVPVSLLNPTFTLTRTLAATMNGMSAVTSAITAIGAGALGSQVLTNLIRCGFGTWTLVDRDRLLPHNLARHSLDGFAVGAAKVVALAQVAGSMIPTEPRPKAIVADPLFPGGDADRVRDSLVGATSILDLSASVPVARALCHDYESTARRVSLFLSPTGHDLVLLAEDDNRSCRLDHLEHQLYREVLSRPELANHMKRPEERLRYAQSCRDVSSRLPQHLVALHGAIGSHAVRNALSSDNASACMWRAADDMAVSVEVLKPEATLERRVGDWCICSDQRFFDKIASLRKADLPNETGGVLLGSFDLERKIIYLIDTILSPPDSEKWPTLYIRGAEGLEAEVKRVSEITAGMIQYIGEWHSHPRGIAPLPSADDCTVFAWLTELMDRDGFPAVMMIAGDSEQSVFVGRMVRGEAPC